MDRQLDLYHGDCLEVLPRLARASVDLVFTSPPYFNARAYARWLTYEGYLDWLQNLLMRARDVLRPGRPLVLNVSCVIEPRASRAEESRRRPIPFDAVVRAERAGFRFVDDILWVKPDGASGRAVKFAHHRRPVAYKPFQVTEYVLVFRRDDGGLVDNVIRAHPADVIAASLVPDGYARTNVWEIAPETDPDHPAPFPLELARRVVRYYSFVGDTVLDPCMGRGTTGWAALDLDRSFVGVERDARYFRRAQTELDARLAQARLI